MLRKEIVRAGHWAGPHSTVHWTWQGHPNYSCCCSGTITLCVLAVQRFRNKTKQLPPWGGARSCSLASSFKVQLHLNWRPSQFSVFWGQIKERKKKFTKVFAVATCPNNVLRTTLPVKLTSSLSPDTNIYSLFELHQKVISGNKSWSIICWQAVCSKYEIFKTQNSCYMTYSLAEESNLML